jgi:hypothetical protein
MIHLINHVATDANTIGLLIRIKMFDKDDDKIIGYLEDQGAISWDGLAEDGQAVFRFNLERLKEVMPEMYDEIMSDIDSDLMMLYEEGLVEIEYDEDLNAMFRATEKGRKWAEELGFPPFPLQD